MQTVLNRSKRHLGKRPKCFKLGNTKKLWRYNTVKDSSTRKSSPVDDPEVRTNEMSVMVRLLQGLHGDIITQNNFGMRSKMLIATSFLTCFAVISNYEFNFHFTKTLFRSNSKIVKVRRDERISALTRTHTHPTMSIIRQWRLYTTLTRSTEAQSS